MSYSFLTQNQQIKYYKSNMINITTCGQCRLSKVIHNGVLHRLINIFMNIHIHLFHIQIPNIDVVFSVFKQFLKGYLFKNIFDTWFLFP